MSFRVTARTILHMGSELISSDGVAFYELIKNSLDAMSPEVRIDVVQRIDFETYDTILRRLRERRDLDEHSDVLLNGSARTWEDLRRLAVDAVDREAPNAEALVNRLMHTTTRAEFSRLIREANYIEIDDDGEGMSAKTLVDAYLTQNKRFGMQGL